MRFFRSFALIVPATLLLFAACGAVQAQTPTPSLTPEPLCESPNSRDGGTYTFGNVEVTLPDGTYGVTIPPPGVADPTFALCHQETGAVLELSASDCEEVRRVAPGDEAEAIIDAIVGSCSIAPEPTSTLTPPPMLCAEGEVFAGEQFVTIADSIQVRLPAGNFAINVNDGVAQICNQIEGYSLVLRLTDCSRVDIAPPDAPAAIAEIASSCMPRIHGTPAPTVAATMPPPGIITPPSTGSAGLASLRP